MEQEENTYMLAIYKRTEVFKELPEVPALEQLKKYYPALFPVKFYVSPKDYVAIQEPQEFSRSLAPEGYYTDDDVEVTIISGANGERISFTMVESDPEYVPCNILLKWNNQGSLPPVETLENLLMGFIEEFLPDSGFVANCEFFHSDELYERAYDALLMPHSIQWITWLSPVQVQTIGKAKIEALEDIVKLQACGGGYLLTLTEEPFDNTNEAHRRKSKEVEDRLGLTKMYQES